MLGRMIGSKYHTQPYQLIDPRIVQIAKKSDLVIANLESPLAVTAKTEGDHLQFAGNPALLNELDFINLFSTANNHITDCGEIGIDETIAELNNSGFIHNGVFKDTYEPFIFSKDGESIAVITLTDMLNIPFDNDSKWKLLRFDDEKIKDIIAEQKKLGRYVIVFAHVGMLFTRYPNPITFNRLHEYINVGADLIVTVHSHCLGGMECYNEKLIFHSLGDFCMDGNSSRRRTAAMLNVEVLSGKLINWEIIPTIVSDDLIVNKLNDKNADKIIQSFDSVSKNISKYSSNYTSFFKSAYKKELLCHSLSTLTFIYRSRGLRGMIKMMWLRLAEVGRTIYWMISDRSNVQRDDDAIKADRKKISQEELFGK